MGLIQVDMRLIRNGGHRAGTEGRTWYKQRRGIGQVQVQGVGQEAGTRVKMGQVQRGGHGPGTWGGVCIR